MNSLYALNLRQLPENWEKNVLPGLPKARQERVLACRAEQERIRLTAAGWLLQRALEGAGIPAREQILDTTTLGKPYLKKREDVQFSLSHSGCFVLCAVGDHPLGVDVEQRRCTMEIARRFFAPAELAGLETLTPAEQADRLCRLWTAKEAFVKALGGGLTIPLDRFTVELSCSGAKLFQKQSPLPYVLHEYDFGQYRACLCAVGERPEPEYLALS